MEWCDEHHLLINVKKTKEIIVDPRSTGDHTKIQNSNNEIERVTSCKYLGSHIDGEITLDMHVKSVQKYTKKYTFCKDSVYLG